MIGYNRDELIGKNIIKPALAPEYSCGKKRIDQKSILPYNIEAFRKNGERFWAEIETRKFEKDGQALRVTAIRGISRHKKTEKLLLARNEMLKSIEQGAYFCELKMPDLNIRHL
jgi:PAS domain S-box-containing protein